MVLLLVLLLDELPDCCAGALVWRRLRAACMCFLLLHVLLLHVLLPILLLLVLLLLLHVLLLVLLLLLLHVLLPILLVVVCGLWSIQVLQLPPGAYRLLRPRHGRTPSDGICWGGGAGAPGLLHVATCCASTRLCKPHAVRCCGGKACLVVEARHAPCCWRRCWLATSWLDHCC